MKKSILGQLVIAAVVPMLAWAQPTAPQTQPARSGSADTTTSTKAAQGATAAQGMRDARASKLIGMDVRNPQNERLGEIKDLIIDVRNGRVQYAVLSFGGVMGLGDKLFAYPVAAFKTAADRDELVLNVDRDRLKEAPGFERSRWPNLRQYAADVDRFFARIGIGERSSDRVGRNDGDARPDVIGRNDSATGTAARADRGERATTEGRDRPAARSDLAQNPNLLRASELIGRNVQDRSNRNAGEIEDLVVSMGNGRVRYVVVDFDKAWSPDDKLLALPLTALRFDDRGKTVTLNVARERLDMTRGFDEKQWPDLNDTRFRGDIDRFLSGFVGDSDSPRAGNAPRGTAGGAPSR